MEHTNVKILAISDVPSKALWDYDTRARLEGIDLILSCGDLPKKYLEYLTNFTAAPILYVHGNHDGSYKGDEPGGCICVDDQVYTWKGLRIMGLGGSIKYNMRPDSYQYTEKEMSGRVRKLRRKAHKAGGIDLLCVPPGRILPQPWNTKGQCGQNEQDNNDCPSRMPSSA